MNTILQDIFYLCRRDKSRFIRGLFGIARDTAVMRRLDTLVADFPYTYKLIQQNEVFKTYSFPKSYISYHKPRAVSTEQKNRLKLNGMPDTYKITNADFDYTVFYDELNQNILK